MSNREQVDEVDGVASEVFPPDVIVSEVSVEVPKNPDSKESFFGTMLLVVGTIFLVSVIAGFGWKAYSLFRVGVIIEETKVPLDRLPERIQAMKAADSAPADSGSTAVATNSGVSPVVDPLTTDIRVLNGGSFGGSAGKVADKLKTGKFVKVTTGNTAGKYVGMTVYYLDGYTSAADAVRTALAATYPKGMTAAADAAKVPESVSASIVVVLGR